MIREPDPTRPIYLRGASCIYCGNTFGPRGTESEKTRDHVIGRRFVPKGFLSKEWNLQVSSCRKCNATKAALEDDISAITLQPNHPGESGLSDALSAEAMRKARGAVSGRTGKLVAESQEGINAKGLLFPGVSFSLNMICGPQLNLDRAFNLALYHIAAFFQLTTWDVQARRGKWWPGSFMPVLCSRRPDWGNVVLLAFQDLLANWDLRFIGSSARGFFKIMIRRYPSHVPLWAWALEWNKSTRLIGFMGDESEGRKLAAALPRLESHVVEQRDNYFLRARAERPIDAKSDRLFFS